MTFTVEAVQARPRPGSPAFSRRGLDSPTLMGVDRSDIFKPSNSPGKPCVLGWAYDSRSRHSGTPLFPRVSLRFLPLPSLSLRPVLSGSLHFGPQFREQGVLHSPFARISHQILSRSRLPYPYLRPVISGSSYLVAAPPSRPQ
jgi:hypothetical protein